MTKSFRWSFFGAVGGILLTGMLMYIPSMAQQLTGTPMLKAQPNSPLEIISMQPAAVSPPTPNMPDWLLKSRVAYNLVVRNRSEVPIMAWTINFLSRPDTTTGTCATRPSYAEPLLKPGQTMTIYEPLRAEGPTMTPDIDMVILQNGTFYGRNACFTLGDYTSRLSERWAVYEVIARRLEREGMEKTTAWLKQELSRDFKPLFYPKKIQ